MDAPPVRILLVDDDEDQFVITRCMLEEARHVRFTLEWVPSAREAVVSLTRNLHDICFMDYQLGADTGLEVLQEAIAGGCRVPVIMLPGRSEYEVDLAATRAGASDFMQKDSINPQLRERAIRYAMERKRAQEDRAQKEKLVGILELAGTVCHELNQPLQIVVGLLEMFPRKTVAGDTNALEILDKVMAQVQRMAQITGKLQNITRYESQTYVQGTNIVNLDRASAPVQPRP
jgi:FixJ family two-component response regulator